MDTQTSAYDPYTYNPLLRAFYVNSNFTNRKTQPDARIVSAAEQSPQAAQHLYSVWGFLDWLQTSNPALYKAIANTPLADPVQVVASGDIAPRARGARVSVRKGLGALMTDDYGVIIGDSESPPSSGAVDTGYAGIVSDWGTKLFDLAGKYLQYDTQKQLLKTNLARAEKGLPPIDPGSIAPTVNVGVSPQVQQLGYLAVGGLILAGIVSAMRKK